MQLFLTKNRILTSDSCRIGYCKENNSECLNIQIEDEALHSKRAYIEFQVNDGNTYTTDALEIVNGVVSYKVPNGLVSEAGFLYMQVVLRDDENNVSKSNILMFTIDKAINAEDDLVLEYPDLITKIDETLNKVDDYEKEINDLKNDFDTTIESLQPKLVSGENIKTINNESILGSGNIDTREIVNVDVLPNGWKGTPVPREGYIEKVYFNTNLSVEETNQLIAIVRDGLSDNKVYCVAHTVNAVLPILEICFYSNNRIKFINDGTTLSIYENNIWNISEVSFNREIDPEIPVNYIIGHKNDLISSLVSITPFEQVDLTKSIYRLPNGTMWVWQDEWVELATKNNSGIIDVEELPAKWVGTPVPTSGYVDKIYFNTNLSSTEVESIVRSVALLNATQYYLYIRADDNYKLYIYTAQGGGFAIGGDVGIYSSTTGWKDSAFSPIEVKGNNITSDKSNDLLASLVSTTPFEKPNSNLIYRLPDGTLWMYHNDEWKQIGDPDNSNLQLIDLTEYGSYDILPSDIADKIRKLGKNALLLLSYSIPSVAHFKEVQTSKIVFEFSKVSHEDRRIYRGFVYLHSNNQLEVKLYNFQVPSSSIITDLQNNKQDILVSGENIKTINGQSLLGEGDITIKGGSGGSAGVQLKLVETVGDGSANILEVSDSDSNKISLTKPLKPNTIYMITYFDEYSADISALLSIGSTGSGASRVSIMQDGGCYYSATLKYDNSQSLILFFTRDDSTTQLDPITKLEIYELTSGGSSIDGEIIEVDELPNAWKGTPITKDTTRVYFNTSLSYQEIKYLFSKICDTFNKYDSETIIEDYDGRYNLLIFVNDDYKIQINVDFGDDVIYTKEDGWIFDENYIDIDYEIYYLTEHANTLSPLFSSTPFEKVDINTNAIYRLPDGSLWKYQDGWKAYIPEDISMAIQSSNLKLNMLRQNDNGWSYNGECTVSIPINDTLKNLLDEGKLRLQLVKLNKKGRKKGTGVRGWAFPKIPFGVGSETFNNDKSDDSYGVGEDYPENSINPYIELDSSNVSENGKYIVSNPINVREIARCMCYWQSDGRRLLSADLDLDGSGPIVCPTSDVSWGDNTYKFRVVGTSHDDAYKSCVIKFKIALIHKDDYNIYSLSNSTIRIRYVPYQPDSNPERPLFIISTLIE